MDVGRRLREVRERSALSQRALAKRCGISNATISLIESNKLNPSVAVLKRILDGAQMELSAFFAGGRSRSCTSTTHRMPIPAGPCSAIRRTKAAW